MATFGNESTIALPNVDNELSQRIADLTRFDSDFWSFSSRAQRDARQAYFHYPAMMNAGMQRELLHIMIELVPEIENAIDVFAGSGTVLSEAMRFGIDVRVQDINPLAVLLCNVKAGPYLMEELRAETKAAVKRAENSTSDEVTVQFSGIEKWFSSQAAIELSRIRSSIMKIEEKWIRRFLWTTLAETIRLTSNSRTSTYKLHIRDSDSRKRIPLPMKVFGALCEQNLAVHERQERTLEGRGFLSNGQYRGSVECKIADARYPIQGIFDLAITSPPYGDNQTTVPYGQASYLPLQWINLSDIEDEVDSELLRSTLEIDRRSLGGVLVRGDTRVVEADLIEMYPTLRRVARSLEMVPADRLKRVVSFTRDLELASKRLVDALRSNAYLFWIVGNRRVGGIEIELDQLLTELLESHGAIHVATAARRIPTKRMATRNSIALTMRSERLLVFRKI